jgi:hypothetical protein
MSITLGHGPITLCPISKKFPLELIFKERLPKHENKLNIT